jgi:periplasmic protein TonB
MAATANIFLEREDWRGSLLWSAVVHGLFFGGIFTYSVIFGGLHAENWGGTTGGSAMSATLVTSASVPLPAPEIRTEQVLSNESKGLTQSLKPEVRPPQPEDIPIPDRAKPKPKIKQQASVTPPRTPPPPDERVPYGEGGQPSTHYTMVNLAGNQGGLAFDQGGDFGARYAWYVNVVRQKVADNWRRYEIDPSIPSAPRVYITFEIARSGEPQNVQVAQSSGIPSLDISAVRALQRIDTFGPLPGDYSGGRVSVEFWFEYKK